MSFEVFDAGGIDGLLLNNLKTSKGSLVFDSETNLASFSKEREENTQPERPKFTDEEQRDLDSRLTACFKKDSSSKQM